MLTCDLAIARLLSYNFEVLAFKVFTHHGRPVIGDRPLHPLHALIADTTGTLRLLHQKLESIRLWRILLYRDLDLRSLQYTPAFDRFLFDSSQVLIALRHLIHQEANVHKKSLLHCPLRQYSKYR